MEILVNPNSPDDFTGGKFHRPKKTSAAVLDFWIGCELPVVAGRTVTTSRTTNPIDIQYPPVIPLEYIGVLEPQVQYIVRFGALTMFLDLPVIPSQFPRLYVEKRLYSRWKQKIYISYWKTIRTWKVDGVTPMYSSIMAPLQNATFLGVASHRSFHYNAKKKLNNPQKGVLKMILNNPWLVASTHLKKY